MNPEDFQAWIAVLGKPTMGVVAVFVLVIYKDLVIHFGKVVLDIVGSWLKRV